MEIGRNRKNISWVDLRIIIFAFLALFILGYIFSNSLQAPSGSNERSKNISKTIQSVVDPQKKIEEPTFHKYTRKAAHALEFMALGLCVSGAFYNVYLKSGKKYISLLLFLGLSSSFCDEYIQGFKKGRSSETGDILIDFGGFVLGFLIIFIISIIIYKRKKGEKCNAKRNE